MAFEWILVKFFYNLSMVNEHLKLFNKKTLLFMSTKYFQPSNFEYAACGSFFYKIYSVYWPNLNVLDI